MSARLLRWTLIGAMLLPCLYVGVIEFAYRSKSGRWLTYGMTTRVVYRDDRFGVEAINGTLTPRQLQILPDRSFQGIACQNSVFYRAILEQWDRESRRWIFVRELSPLDVLNQDQVPSKTADSIYLWPGGNVCAGWFPRSLVEGAPNETRFRVSLLERFTIGRADRANRVVAITDVRREK